MTPNPKCSRCGEVLTMDHACKKRRQKQEIVWHETASPSPQDANG